jgi:hypothetical protein
MSKEEIRLNMMCFASLASLRFAWVLKGCDWVMEGSINSKEGCLGKEINHRGQAEGSLNGMVNCAKLL